MYKFKIDKLGCMNCVSRIEEELKVLDQELHLKPNLEERTLEVKSTLP